MYLYRHLHCCRTSVSSSSPTLLCHLFLALRHHSCPMFLYRHLLCLCPMFTFATCAICLFPTSPHPIVLCTVSCRSSSRSHSFSWSLPDQSHHSFVLTFNPSSCSSSLIKSWGSSFLNSSASYLRKSPIVALPRLRDNAPYALNSESHGSQDF